jgi:hypothetical protein
MGRLVRGAGKPLDAPLEIIRNLQTGGCHEFNIDIAGSQKLLPQGNEVNTGSETHYMIDSGNVRWRFRTLADGDCGAGDGNRKYRSGANNLLKSMYCDVCRALRAIFV